MSRLSWIKFCYCCVWCLRGCIRNNDKIAKRNEKLIHLVVTVIMEISLTSPLVSHINNHLRFCVRVLRLTNS